MPAHEQPLQSLNVERKGSFEAASAPASRTAWIRPLWLIVVSALALTLRAVIGVALGGHAACRGPIARCKCRRHQGPE
eukprot:2662488-Pyramimonas_sp.AAC.1